MHPGRSARPGSSRSRALHCLMLVALLLAGCTRGAATPSASPATVASPAVASPVAGGTPRTVGGTERKVDAILLEILDTYRLHGRERAEQQAREAGVLGEDNLVRLTLVLTDTNTAPVAAKITSSGGQVTGISGNVIEIEVPLERWLTYLSSDGRDMMQDLAGYNTVHEVRVTPPVHTQGFVSTAELERAIGAFTTEGVAASGADSWQEAGYSGQGVKIGVIDVGFGGYEELIGSELPSLDRLQVRSYASDKTMGKELHGTAVAEIVHDMAPDASLWLVRIDTNLSTDRAIRWLVDEVGVDLISMSIGSAGYYRADGSSVSAKAVDYAFSKGVLCIIAAGNEADAHYGATYLDEDGDGYHDIAPGNADLKITAFGSQVTIILNWEAWSGLPIDLNLEVYDASGKLLRASNNVQNTVGRSPVEYVTVSTRANQSVFARVTAVGDPGAVPLNIFTQAGEPEILTPGGSLATPGDARFGLSVGAVRWDNERLERYSSQGPTADGRIKPDIAGPTVVQTVAYGNGGNRFNGTSAATPHVSGAAALFLSANPEATTEEIVQFLWGRAEDTAPTGADNLTGYGILRLGEPPTAPAPPRTTPAPSSSAVLAAPTPPSVATRPPAATPVTPTPPPGNAGTPVPAITPTPASPTPTRPPVLGPPGATFSDPLGTSGTGLPEGGETTYAEGQYRIAPNEANRAAWATYGSIFVDARIEVTAQFATATPGAAGIIFWHASPEDYYLFAIATDGYYQISHFQGGRWTALVPWAQSAAIENGRTNRLQVETAGTQVTASVNGQRLASVSDPGGGSGGVGMLATTFAQPGAAAGFTDFSVSAGP